jgi:type II secretory pathway component PulF
MATFRYKARDKHGSLFTGSIETTGPDAVAAQLDNLGYIPVSIEQEKEGVGLYRWLQEVGRVDPQDLVVFSRQFATLISAGLPFLTIFETLIEQTENKHLKRVLSEVRNDVERGSSLSDAFAKHPRVFSRLYVSMIHAGETGGVLDEILNRLAYLAEHEAKTRAQIKSATRYPKIVLFAIIVAFMVLVTFVVPRFAALYANFNVKLPLPTRILIATNYLIQNHWYWLLGGVVLLIVGVRWYIHTPAGRLWWDGTKIRLPIFGPIFLKTSLSRFSRVFGMLTSSGLPILQNLEIVSETVGNVVIARVVDNIRDSARQGRGLVEPMRVSRIFPPIVVQMVAVGEETGKIEEMLTKVSDYFDTEVEYSIRNLSTALEPLILTVIGGLILLLALAIFMPWWNLINVFRGGGG